MISYASPRYRSLVIALAIGSFVVFANLYLFQPMLPFYAQHFAISETQVNLLFAATALGLSMALIPMALLSEKYSRRRMMHYGLLAIPFTALGVLLSEAFYTLVFWRAIMGISLAAFASVAVAYMAEELDSNAFAHAMGSYVAANAFGGIMGRLCGGLLTQYFNPETAIATLLILSLFGVLLVWKLLPEQEHTTLKTPRFSHHIAIVIQHFRQPNLWFAMLIGGVNFALFVNLYSVVGFRLVSAPYSLPIGLASLIFLGYLGGTFSARMTGRWQRYFTSPQGMRLGCLISVIGLAACSFDPLFSLAIGLLLISGGAFFTHALAYAWVGRWAEQGKATASALYLVHYYIGGSLGGFLLLWAWQHGGWFDVTLVASLLYLMLFALTYTLSPPERVAITGTASD
ncbi:MULTISPECIES: MFS transporter [unclassified Vibrio]|uniref:MFS transporter n=1 Tax=Vibrio sp. HB236076 TaxID=3232307 RepID=A0AB39HBF6_9VIBR|nr:MFS transporter [Vibrio sp. HB161653]MDP5253467.1 MFS transporter [Vibrio sp. HB161653]